MFAHKAKPFPGIPANSALFPLSQTCAFILAANWVMQGMRGMDRGELVFRFLAAGAIAGALSAIQPSQSFASLAAALAVAHSLNFALNGHPWVCLRYCHFYRRSPAAIDAWLDIWIQRIQRIRWVEECVILGSRARGSARPRADIDLRLIISGGVPGWLKINLLLLLMRVDAAFRAIPLDAYAYDTPKSLLRFDQSEALLIISDRRTILQQMFAHRRYQFA